MFCLQQVVVTAVVQAVEHQVAAVGHPVCAVMPQRTGLKCSLQCKLTLVMWVAAPLQQSPTKHIRLRPEL